MTQRIETYSLFEFCQAVQEAILDGWRFDFESNENFPTAYGSMLIAGMVKVEKNKEQEQDEVTTDEDTTEEVTEVETPVVEETTEEVAEDTTDEVTDEVTEETTEADAPAKRGPKPKAK